jgi:DNA-binding transcriptional LysR family regulator
MELAQLEQFLMIEKSRSMRLAAEKLFLSQPSLSLNLKKLEDELDCKLFTRSNNQLILNDYGKIMLEYSERVIAEIQSAKRAIEEEKERQAVKIKVGCYSYAFQNFILPQLANALQQNVFQCEIGEKQHLTEKLSADALDIVFSDCDAAGDAFTTTKLFNEQIMVSVPSSSKYAYRQCLYIDELPSLNLYMITGATGYSDWFGQILSAAGIKISSSNGAPMREYLYTKDNLDLCHLTTSFIARFAPVGVRKVIIPIADGKAGRDICMSYKKKDQNRLSSTIDYVENHLDALLNNGSFLAYFQFPDKTRNILLADDIK